MRVSLEDHQEAVVQSTSKLPCFPSSTVWIHGCKYWLTSLLGFLDLVTKVPVLGRRVEVCDMHLEEFSIPLTMTIYIVEVKCQQWRARPLLEKTAFSRKGHLALGLWVHKGLADITTVPGIGTRTSGLPQAHQQPGEQHVKPKIFFCWCPGGGRRPGGMLSQ